MATFHSTLLSALPTPAEIDPRLMSAALGPGRIRGIAGEIDAKARLRTDRAEGELRKGLREARALHSRERRFVGDVLRDLARYDLILDALLCESEPTFLGRWLGWMVVLGAALPDVKDAWKAASKQHPPDFSRVQNFASAVGEHITGMDETAALALVGAIPMSLAQAMVARQGTIKAAAYMAASNRRADVVLRANVARTDRTKLAHILRQQGLETSPSDVAIHGLIVSGRANLEALPAFKKGLFEVQDAGSQVLAELVAPDNGPIVDFCAGAGGKTLALAAAMKGKGTIVSLDVRRNAIIELKRRAKRARVHSVSATEMAPTGPLPWQAWNIEGEASRVFVDAPCSGSGVLRRHPEYRWRLNDVSRFPPLQRAILERSAPLVAIGGRLIYGTCSVIAAENEDVANGFLADHPEFRLLPANEVLGAARAEQLGVEEYMHLSPATHRTDGFFGAVFERIS